LVGAGVLGELLCCLGLVAMRDVFDRIHFAMAATTVPPFLIAAAVIVEEDWTQPGINALVIAVVLFLVNPMVAHATARAARVRRRVRLGTFAVSGSVLAALFVWALTDLPDFGDFRGEYGRILNSVTGSERHVTNVVAAVVFDYRGFDTLGEEFLLFAAVMAVALLLREARSGEERRVDRVQSDGVRAGGLFAAGPTVVLGLDVVADGDLAPGGGYQAG